MEKKISEEKSRHKMVALPTTKKKSETEKYKEEK